MRPLLAAHVQDMAKADWDKPVGHWIDARQAVYDAFSQDARAAEQQQANTIQRQGQIGQLFMDQAKAAVPIYSKNVDLASQAMRQQFEERMAAQRAARAASSGSLTGAAAGAAQAEKRVAFVVGNLLGLGLSLDHSTRPLAYGIWFWSVLTALVAWTLVQTHDTTDHR